MAKQPTVEQIKERLDELEVEYPSNAKKDELLEILNEAVDASEAKETEENDTDTENEVEEQEEVSEGETEEEPEDEVEEDEETGEITKSDYRNRKRKSRKPENSNEIAHRVIASREAKLEKKNEKLLKKKGYNWYRADARTVLEDGRITRPGFYYPVHKDEVERVGTYNYTTDKKASKRELSNGNVKTDARGFKIEKKARLVKETPEEGIKRKDSEEAFDANDFIG